MRQSSRLSGRRRATSPARELSGNHPTGCMWKSARDKALTQAADSNNPVMYIAVEGEDHDLPMKAPLRHLLSLPVRTSVQR